MSFAGSGQFLVAVVFRLEGSLLGQAKVVALLLGQLGEVDVESAKVGEGDLLVELLGEHVHAQGVFLDVVPQLDRGKHLVGERGRHDEAGVTHGTAKVDKTTLSQQDDVLAVLQGETIDLEKGMIS